MFYFFSLIFFVFSACIARLDRYFYKANDSFCLKYIQSSHGLSHMPLPSDQEVGHIRHILNQPFHYWKKGKQSYVFLSEDARYVLKFYRLAYRPEAKKFSIALSSTKHAYEALQEETHLLAFNLPLDQELLIIDKLGVPYHIHLAQLPWVLQERGERFFTRFDELIKKDEEQARLVIAKTIDLFKRCWKKDYVDFDVNARKNFGLLDLSPMIIDVGKIEKGAQKIPLIEYLLDATSFLRDALQEESPSLYRDYQMLIHEPGP